MFEDKALADEAVHAVKKVVVHHEEQPILEERGRDDDVAKLEAKV